MRKEDTGSYIWGYHEDTPSEKKLASLLKRSGLRFDREVMVGGFRVDFLIEGWLVIEVDGESHLVSGRQEKDESRQTIIEQSGFTVLRIPSRDLSSKTGEKTWLARIRDELRQGRPTQRSYAAQARKALRAGQKEKRRRESLALESRIRSKGLASSETMEDYFGESQQDFASLLKDYDWSKKPE